MARDALTQGALGVLLLLGAAIGAPAAGLAQTCGDSSVAGGEECDDGNAFGGDGCAANCTLEHDVRCELAAGSGKFEQAIFSIDTPLSGQIVLTVGRLRSDLPAQPIPFVIPAGKSFLAPATIPGIGLTCSSVAEIPGWGEGNAGGGVIDCGSAPLSGIDVLATIDAAESQPMLMVQRSGTGAMGSASFEIGLASYGLQPSAPFCVAAPGTGPPQYGADAIPCTHDDGATGGTPWHGGTGSATARVLDAGSGTRERMVTGVALDCAQLDGTGALDGGRLAAVVARVGVPLFGNVASSVSLECAPVGVLATPTPRIIQTCVPPPTATPTPGFTPIATATGGVATETRTPTASAPPTATEPLPVTATSTPTSNASASPTRSPTMAPNTSVPTATETPVSPVCPGDCNLDRLVTQEEVEIAIDIALGSAPVSLCHAADVNGADTVTIDGLVRAVTSLLQTCAG